MVSGVKEENSVPHDGGRGFHSANPNQAPTCRLPSPLVEVLMSSLISGANALVYAVAIGVTVLCAVYLWSDDVSRRNRAWRLLNLLLRLWRRR